MSAVGENHSFGRRSKGAAWLSPLVPWGVGLSPATSANPIVSCQHGDNGWDSNKTASRKRRRKVGMTSNHHGLYAQGDTRATMVGTEGCDTARWANPRKPISVRIGVCNRLHEVGIASNRASAMARWIRSRTLYTPPVKPWVLGVPEDGDFTGAI